MSKSIRPESYFFSEPTVVQLTDQAFGPVAGNEATQFRTTAKFTSASDIKAYAICAGQVFLQPHTDTAKVNLVLRPYRQPINGLAIKYFVYRGLKKADFIPSGDTDLVAHGQVGGATAFIQLLWNQLKTFNGWTNAEADAETFLAKWIGYDPTNQAGDTLIDDYFFMADAYGDENNETLKPFEFPMVPHGTHLGNFTGDYGLDVVLSDGDYKQLSSSTGFQFDLTYARAAENIIDTTQLPTGYIEKQYREAITHFIDPAAFWGLHYENGTVWVNESGTAVKKQGQVIYDDVVANFATKNKVYLYIQGHLGRSYNYYGAYGTELGSADVVKRGTDATEITVAPYATNSWPVLVFDTEQTHTDTTNSLFLQLVFSATVNVVLYGQLGQLAAGAENNFLVAAQLVPETTVAQDGSIVQEDYTNPVEIVVPAVDSGANKANVAGYVHLIYQGVALTATEDVDGTLVERPIKPIDTLFGPVNIEQRLVSANGDVIISSFSSKLKTIDVIGVDNDGAKNQIAVQVKITLNKIAYEQSKNLLVRESIIYESELVDGIGQGIFLRSNPNSSGVSASGVPFLKEQNNTYELTSPFYFDTNILTDFDRTINGLTIKSTEKEYPNKFLLGLSKQENDILKTLVGTENLINTSLFLAPILIEESPFLSIENVQYYKFHLNILGEDATGNAKILSPDSPVVIYSMDQNIYFSSDYSQYIESRLDTTIDNVTLDKTL